jgi:hypothetical protein
MSGTKDTPHHSDRSAHLRVRDNRPLVALSVALVVVAVAALLVATIGAGGSKGGGTGGTSPGGSHPTSTQPPGNGHHPRPGPPPNPAKSRTFLGPDGLESTWVIAENKLPGTTAWKITGQPATGFIEGFANHTYAADADVVKLYVSATSPGFRVEAYRMGYYGGLGGRLVWSSPPRPGGTQPACPLTAGINMVSCANWKASIAFRLSSAWLPGDYLLKLIGSGNQQSYIPLTVWDPASRSAYVVLGSIFTEAAWNTYGGYNFYQGLGTCANTYPVCNRARVASLDRPFASGQGASDFMSNEYPVIRFAEAHGLDVTYANSLTIAEHPAWLAHHQALFSLGHDECWSYAERVAAQRAYQHGVNLIFFGASAVLRHVRVEGSPLGGDRQIVDYRDPTEDPLNGKASPLVVTANTWSSPPTNWPESGLVGEMYAGFIEPGDPAVPFVVSDASAWIFRGTGLHDGSTLPGVISADFDHVAPSWPMPSDLQVLGHSPIPLSEVQTDLGNFGKYTYSDMTYYSDPKSKAGVFDSGNNNWIAAMAPCPSTQPSCPAVQVQRITGNLFWLFGQGPAGKVLPSVANWQQVTPPGS